jgi:dihydroorotate dehydrogenase electron transfer subunit
MTSEHARDLTLKGVVTGNSRIAKDHVLLSIRAGEIFLTSSPGQFVMIRVTDAESPFLGRPISIYALRREDGNAVIDLMVRVVGRGTSYLSRLKAGDWVDLLGPLGNGFSIFPDRRNIVLIAGGIGIAPLSFLADGYSHVRTGEIACYFGARSENVLIGLDRVNKTCSKLLLSTEDGSRGHRGLITDLFERDLNQYKTEDTVVYACGPFPMLMKIQDILMDTPLFCQVSVEERMACGIGACLGCAVRMKSGEYGRVCHEGPVFNIDELAFDQKD